MKKFKIAFIGAIISSLVFVACKKDIDLLADYTESVAIYGILNQADSVQYIRVNKVYLTAEDASIAAQIKDSVYFSAGDLSVTVEKYWNGIKKQTYNFTEYYLPTLTGTFNNQQLIYKNTQVYKADSAGKDFEYKLIVRKLDDGKIYTATTKLIKDFTCNGISPSSDCFSSNPNVSFASAVGPTQVKVKFGSPIYAKMCGFRYVLHYVDSTYSNGYQYRSLDFDYTGTRVPNTAGGHPLDFTFSSASFYSRVASLIPQDPNVSIRRVDSVSFYLTAGAEEYSTYMEVNAPSTSLAQDKPIYTNINNGGIGIFSARFFKKYTKRPQYLVSVPQSNYFSNNSINYLSSSPETCLLKFVHYEVPSVGAPYEAWTGCQ